MNKRVIKTVLANIFSLIVCLATAILGVSLGCLSFNAVTMQIGAGLGSMAWFFLRIWPQKVYDLRNEAPPRRKKGWGWLFWMFVLTVCVGGNVYIGYHHSEELNFIAFRAGVGLAAWIFFYVTIRQFQNEAV